MLLVAGCASWHTTLPIPPEVTQTGVAEGVLISPDLNVSLPETVIKPGTPDQASASPPATPPIVARSPDRARTASSFALPDAIAFGLQYNPRLRSARAAIERAQGQEQVTFAPFLPQVDVLGQYGVTSSTFVPAYPGPRDSS
jgi:outer membrane protein TolC